MPKSRLDQFDKGERKQVVKAATRLYKSGAEPSEPVEPRPLRRYEQRQLARALGWRGSKAKRQKNVTKRLEEVRQALVVDDALIAAKERVEHPVRSRLKR